MWKIGYWLAKCGAFMNAILPFGLLYLKSDLYSFLLYHVVRYRRKVVRNNLVKSFPEKSLPEIKRIERRFYRNFCDLVVEMCKLLVLKDEQLRSRMVVTNPEVLDELYGKGRSVFLAMQHSGNWEWYCNFMNRMVPHRTVDIYKKLTNPSFNALVYQLRTNRSDDDEMMVEDRAAKAFFEHLDQQRRAILFVADQSPRGVETDYWTEFLHQDTCWYPGLEYLARRCDFAVVFIDMKRTGRGRYNITYLPICEDPNTMEQGAIMEQYVRHVERFILEQPDNWLWSHRRWKHSREGMAS